MSRQKVDIPIEKIRELAETLKALASVADRALKDLEESKMKCVAIDGWPTLVKSLVLTQDQLKKLVGPTNLIHSLNPRSILLPGMDIERQIRGTRKAKADVAEATQQVLKDKKRKP